MNSKEDFLSILKIELELLEEPFTESGIFVSDSETTNRFWKWLEDNWDDLSLSDWVESMEDFRQILDRRYLELEGIGYMLDEFTGQFDVNSDYMIEVFVDFCWLDENKEFAELVYNRIVESD